MLPSRVSPSNGVLPGGKTGHSRILNDPGPSNADNGKPDLCTGSPPLHYPGSDVGKKSAIYGSNTSFFVPVFFQACWLL